MWKKYTFSEFVEINPKVKMTKGEIFSYVEMKDLSDGKKICLPSDQRVFNGGSKFLNNDTLFARITPCLENGKICQVKGLGKGVGFGSTEFLVYRGKQGISDNDFVYYLARWDEVRSYAEMNFDGTSGRQRVPVSAFDNLELLVPPLREQTAIASVLSSLDDKIDLLHCQNQTLESLAETIFRQLFIVKVDEKWKEAPLDSIAHFLNGLACQKYPPGNPLERLPVIKIKELRQGFSDNSDQATSKVNSMYIVKNGDVLFSWSGSLEVVLWSHGEGVLNQHLFKVTSDKYPKWFYYLWLKMHLQDFRDIATDKATTMGHIQRKHLNEARVVLPDEKSFEALNIKFEPLIEKCIKNNSQIRTLETLRDTLLPKLMSGEVRVQYDKDEVKKVI